MTDSKRYLSEIPQWELIEGNQSISRTFEFKDFKESMAFVNAVAELAEKQNHHPDITINYNAVTLVLSTHSAGGLTEKDVTLAKAIDQLG